MLIITGSVADMFQQHLTLLDTPAIVHGALQ